LTGFSAEENSGEGGVGCEDCIHPEDRDKVYAEIKCAALDGKPEWLDGAVIEITDKKQIEAELRTSRERL
jgi:hypothetical protein